MLNYRLKSSCKNETARYQPVIDALAAHVAVLDDKGRIVEVNAAWRLLADENNSHLPGYGVGESYFGVAGIQWQETGGKESVETSKEVAAGIREVMSGSKKKFQLEYQCYAQKGNRWFLVTATAFNQGPFVQVVVAHENITALKLAENQARAQATRLAEVFNSMIESIMLVIEKRDPYTARHQRQVAALSVEIGRRMGLNEDRLIGLRLGASIHDIGKITVPSEILGRTGPLSTPESMILREHPSIGSEILQGVDFPWPVTEMVWQHHERMDGTGYPMGIKGEEICLEARIIAVADVFDAIVSHRPYRAGLGDEEALAVLLRGRCAIFDPAVVDAAMTFFADVDYEWHQERRSGIRKSGLPDKRYAVSLQVKAA